MCGYYRERIYYEDADNPSDIKEFLSDFTYGLGINAPLIRLSKGKIPIEVGFDFIKNENPSKYDPDISTPHDFFVWTMTVRWKID